MGTIRLIKVRLLSIVHDESPALHSGAFVFRQQGVPDTSGVGAMDGDCASNCLAASRTSRQNVSHLLLAASDPLNVFDGITPDDVVIGLSAVAVSEFTIGCLRAIVASPTDT